MAGGENTFSERDRRGGRGTGQQGLTTLALPPPIDVMSVESGYSTPNKGEGRGGGGGGVQGAGAVAKASPVESDDGAWDAELDDLLKWTDNLSPLAV